MMYFNQHFDKTKLRLFIAWLLSQLGGWHTIQALERFKKIGFGYATQAGVSLGVDDLAAPPLKVGFVKATSTFVQSSFAGQSMGSEKAQRVIDSWLSASEVLKDAVVDHFLQTDPLNPIYMMAFSGARGSLTQVRQLVGMRGLMVDPMGNILTLPVQNSFREGLSVTEYLISCYGARKGLVDTALRTAKSGYLTRRLVDVAQDVLIRRIDCGTKKGIFLTDLKTPEGNLLRPLNKRLIGRVLLPSNQTIDEKLLKNLKHLDKIHVRSPLTCIPSIGTGSPDVCQLCYGWNLGRGKFVQIGEAVGILAAQSIGEPGTQLTMRTFHTGGAVSGRVSGRLRAIRAGRLCFHKKVPGCLTRTSGGELGFLVYSWCRFSIFTPDKNNFKRLDYKVAPGACLLVRHGQWVRKFQDLAFSPISKSEMNPVLKEYKTSTGFHAQWVYSSFNKSIWLVALSNSIFFNSITNYGDLLGFGEFQSTGILFKGSDFKRIEFTKLKKEKALGAFILEKTGLRRQQINLETGRLIAYQRNWVCLQKAQRSLINNQKLEKETHLNQEGQWVPRGTFLGSFTYTRPLSGDIVQGLPRIDALFEARSTTGLSEKMIKIFNNLLSREINCKKATRLAFTFIQNELIIRIQEAYLDQGVQIDEKHLEVIVRQMTSKVLVNSSGDSPCAPGDLLPLEEAEALCTALSTLGMEELTYEPTLIGITKAALQKKGFLSPASFQDTIRVLLKSSLEAQQDPVRGLKEHVILGQSLPLGTGHPSSQLTT
uniref:DNA-directed RNA polymerase n=1 Tax=Chloropicon maureeniae TaxID=1461542 RepID=A0A4D6C3B9_9CHLO|nr:beta'' subunit of RNA polymerase [Chloropicon maureeniae]QBX98215.1 beta'' subunit of RNA polymerase [Chloropicon maureeniae]